MGRDFPHPGTQKIYLFCKRNPHFHLSSTFTPPPNLNFSNFFALLILPANLQVAYAL
jgi:hypothetical protein